MNAPSVIDALMQGTPAGVRIVEDVEELTAIRQTGCAATVWQRRPLPSFQEWLNGLDPEVLPQARMILRPHAVRDSVRQTCDALGTPECLERDRLIDDVAAMSDIFGSLMQAEWLRLRLDVITTNACRKFHVDAVTARLVCTYRGTGTQYGTGVPNGDPRRIFTVPSGSPIILRGTLWPEEPATGLRHRSPPIEGSGETRLLLVLDPVAGPEDDL